MRQRRSGGAAIKLHSREAGYIAERMNPHVPGKKVVIYRAAEQGLDDADGKYAVVCDAHGTIDNTTSIPNARSLMKAPETFCLDCRALV